MAGVIRKEWGTTELIRQTPLFEAHRIVVLPMHRCSLHVHRFKVNEFLVLKGRLFIETVGDDSPPVSAVEIGPGEMWAAPPNVHHFMRTGDEGCEAYEFYYPMALGEDIERRDHGGPLETVG
jgi:mannose-6-phosphate isomerase-like protein (cupin superfamily)